jgi:anti-sigma factor RsiW
MTPRARRIPDSLLECYLADSLDALTRAQLETLMASSPEDRARLEELRADSAAFLLHHPQGPMVERFRQERKRRRWWRWPELVVPAFAAVFLVLLTFHNDIKSLFTPDAPDILSKGPAILVVHRKTDQGSEVVRSDMPLVPGDSIRFEVKAAGSVFLAVLGQDAHGVVSVYHPYQGTAAVSYDVTQPLLPGAFVLGDTLGREDLYTLTSPRPFDLRWAVKALEQGRDLRSVAPKDVVVGSTFLTIVKAR